MQQTDNTKTCSIIHAPVENCSSIDHTQTTETVNSMDSMTVNVLLNRSSLNGNKFCLIVMAANGPNEARVEGIFNTGILVNTQCHV